MPGIDSAKPAALADSSRDIPTYWEGRVRAELASGESVAAVFESDLNDGQRYAPQLFLLTNRRFLAFSSVSSNSGAPATWSYEEISGWRTRQQHGLGTLELLGAEGLLAAWRFTSARGNAAAKFVQRCNTATAESRGERHETIVTVCPSCGAVLDSGETECPACTHVTTPQTRSLFRLWRFAKPRIGMILLGALLAIAERFAWLAPPFITMRLIDNVLVPRQSNEAAYALSDITPYIAWLLGMALIGWLLTWGRTYVVQWASERVAADARNATYAHLQKLSLEFFGGQRTGDLISRASSDTDKICTFASSTLIDFMIDLLTIVMSSCVMFSIDPWLAVVTLIPFPAIAWLSQIARARLRHGFASGGRAWSEMVSVLADTIPGIRVVKAFAQETRETKRFEYSNERVLEANDRVNNVLALLNPLIKLLADLGLLVIWAFGTWQVTQGQLTVGVLLLFVSYLTSFYARLDSMSRMFAATQRVAAATHRIFAILDRSPSVAEPVKAVHPGRVTGLVELKGVRFSYGTREVIKGIDLVVQPGEMIGLVGPSGAGKSTLVNLICRFYDVASGAIFVDGVDIRSFPVEEYRRNIGIVLQEPFLFYGTIAENIAYGRPDATREQILSAAKAAKAHEFILRLVDGYDSIVGERGQSLSGGERQRISIARALLTDPRLLILDEATSSVDTETEREIQEALDNLTRGRTTIAIAHRLSTLRNASRIVVMERGQITEIGDHDELIVRDGTYARLHNTQSDLTKH